MKKSLFTIAALLTVSVSTILAQAAAAVVKPDLIITSATNFENRTDWRKFTFDLTVKNNDNAVANLGTAIQNTVSVQSWLSKDAVIGNGDDIVAGGLIVGNPPVGTLAPGASRTFNDLWFAYNNVNFSLYPYVIIMIDFGNAVSELNETNNKIILKYNSKPDLQPVKGTDGKLLLTKVNGQYFFKVKNAGTGNSASCNTEVRFNNAVDSNIPTTPINAGQTVQIAFPALPAGCGGCSFELVVDSANGVAETDETNNKAQGLIKI